MRDVDRIITQITTNYPLVHTRQLEVSHPGNDDDGIWFFRSLGCDFEVQIESSTGMCPFVVETDENDARLTGASFEETIDMVIRLLHLTPKVQG